MQPKRKTDKKLKATDGIDGGVVLFAIAITVALSAYVYLMF